MKNKSVFKGIMLMLLPIAAVSVIYLIRPLLYYTVTFFSGCLINKMFGIYCPGCGCTRSIFALLRFDVHLSLRENLTPLVLLIVSLSFYLEPIFDCFGINYKSPVRRKAVWISLVVFAGCYYILRNFIPQIAPI